MARRRRLCARTDLPGRLVRDRAWFLERLRDHAAAGAFDRLYVHDEDRFYPARTTTFATEGLPPRRSTRMCGWHVSRSGGVELWGYRVKRSRCSICHCHS